MSDRVEQETIPSQSGSPQATQNSSHFARLLIFVAVVGALGFLGYYMVNSDPSALPASPLIGKPASSFELEDLATGLPVSLKDLRGEIIVLNFWASWCTSCREEAAELEAVHLQARDKGVRVVGIAIQDDPEKTRAFNAKYGQSFQVLLDPMGEIAVHYGVLGIPETFILDANGLIRARKIGALTRDWIFAEVQRASTAFPNQNSTE